MGVGTLAAIGAGVLALVHLTAPRLHFLRGEPRSVWLSIAGGVSVAYVFVHLLPELAQGQRAISDSLAIAFLERHVYLVALAGLLAFYGLDRLAKLSRADREGEPRGGGPGPEDDADAQVAAHVFWVHMASFAIYNLLVGYLLLHREEQSPASLLIYVVAIALHLLVVDFGLDSDHRHLFRRFGRWILAASVAAGWLIGTMLSLSEAAVAALIAFIGGGVILNVLKEEVPSEQKSRFWAFALGAAVYSALLLAA